MAQTNHSELGDLDAELGANLSLDDESLFAELDNEVLLDDSAAKDADFDLNLDSAGLDEIELAEPSAPKDSLDDLLGGGGAGDGLDDLGLGHPQDHLDDLDLGGHHDELDDLLGTAPAPGGKGEQAVRPEPETAGEALEIDLELDETGEVSLDEDMEALELNLEEDSLAGLDLEQETLGEEISGAGLEEIDAASSGTGEPAAELNLDDLQVASLEEPSEPVFDLEELETGPAASAEFTAAPDIDLAEQPLDLELDEISGMMGEAPAVEEEAIELEPIEEEVFELEPVEEEIIELEPVEEEIAGLAPETPSVEASPVVAEPEEDFIAVPEEELDEIALDVEAPEMEWEPPLAEEPAAEAVQFTPAAPASPVEPEADEEFVAVKDVDVDEDLLDLNLEDVEPPAAAERPMETPMPEAWRAKPQPVPAPLTEQLEIPAKATGLAQPAPTVPAFTNEILLSIAHQISVELGAVSLNGKELMELSYGSVVPINRMVGEPVDLVLAGKPIAQGEIVLINGKDLGVRIVALNK